MKLPNDIAADELERQEDQRDIDNEITLEEEIEALEAMELEDNTDREI